METKLTIQERLRDLRVIDPGLSLEQTGLSKSALGKYESEVFKDISPFAIVMLAKIYGVSTDYLLGLTGKKIPQAQNFKPYICGMMQWMRYGMGNTINDCCLSCWRITNSSS